MDFVVKVPKTSTDNNTICVVVGRLTKSVHLLPMKNTNPTKKLTLYICGRNSSLAWSAYDNRIK